MSDSPKCGRARLLGQGKERSACRFQSLSTALNLPAHAVFSIWFYMFPISSMIGCEKSTTAPSPMAYVNGGFVTNENGDRNYVHNFYIDVYEVTVESFMSCVESGKCDLNYSAKGCVWAMPKNNFRPPKKMKHPANCVTATQAMTYCSWLGRRLPTNEEWLWAAYGDGKRKFPWGDDNPQHHACISSEQFVRHGTCQVGSFPLGASPDGVQDLIGGVSEWTSTIVPSSRSYSSHPRIVRGGSWYSGSKDSVIKDIKYANHDEIFSSVEIGFRCVKDAQ